MDGKSRLVTLSVRWRKTEFSPAGFGQASGATARAPCILASPVAFARSLLSSHSFISTFAIRFAACPSHVTSKPLTPLGLAYILCYCQLPPATTTTRQ